MRNAIRLIGMSLAAMAGFLLVSGAAWANPNKESVSGEVVSWRATDPGEFWVDDDGLWHRRNQLVTVRWAGDIDGRMFAVNNTNWDPSTGDGDIHGSFVFIGYVGEGLDLVTATGRFAGVGSGLPTIWEGDFVWHLDDGRLIKVKQFTSGAAPPPDGPPWDYVGEILDPPGHR